MSYTHVVNGDVAAGRLRQALAEARQDGTVLVLRDDLAVGPIRAIDDVSTVRTSFWQRVIADPGRDVARELAMELTTLRELMLATGEIVVWHGQSAGDQLLLRRLAFNLRNSPQRLNEINLLPQEGSPGASPAPMITVGHFPIEALARRVKAAAPISILRIGRLALEWQELKQSSSDIRRWHDNTFESGSFADVDALILEHAALTARPASELVAAVQRDVTGFIVTDMIILWRCRDLIKAGRLEADAGANGAGQTPLRLARIS